MRGRRNNIEREVDPASDAYWGYYNDRLGDLVGDWYEAKTEDIAERYKAEYWG